MVKRRFLAVTALLVIALFAMSLVSAGIGEWFRHITGYDTKNTGANVTVTGSNSVTIHVWNYTLSGTSVDPTAGNFVSITFNATVTDADGYADINTTSVSANFTKLNEGVRKNTTCLNMTSFGNSINFTCTVQMWYFDATGTWNISVSGKDFGTGNLVQNISTTFTYGSLNSISIYPTLVSFGTVAQGDKNKTATGSTPTTINNTGNVNFTNVSVTGVNLYGEGAEPTQFISVGNLSVGNNTGSSIECDAVVAATLLNGTAIRVYNTTLTRGNLSTGSGAAQEQVYYCFRTIPSVGISSQPYSTSAGGQWTITTAA
jgi:hypothetical protein